MSDSEWDSRKAYLHGVGVKDSSGLALYWIGALCPEKYCLLAPKNSPWPGFSLNQEALQGRLNAITEVREDEIRRSQTLISDLNVIMIRVFCSNLKKYLLMRLGLHSKPIPFKFNLPPLPLDLQYQGLSMYPGSTIVFLSGVPLIKRSQLSHNLYMYMSRH